MISNERPKLPKLNVSSAHFTKLIIGKQESTESVLSAESLHSIHPCRVHGDFPCVFQSLRFPQQRIS